MDVQPEAEAAAAVIQLRGMNKNNLIIFLKYPEPGKVKTRLGKVIGYKIAADIYSVFIKHLLTIFKANDLYNISVYYSPVERKHDILNMIGINDIVPQNGDNLGEKISNAFDSSFSKGYLNTVIIGTDCIDITSDDIENTFKDLSGDYSSVIGPTNDGGYYLIGLSEENRPELFKGIEWSTDKVFTQTIKKMSQINIKNKVLNYYNDIDEISDINSNVIEIINTYKPNLRIQI